jgi:uncharacterized SAM-binding protein YcdF (DUF218 family)
VNPAPQSRATGLLLGLGVGLLVKDLGLRHVVSYWGPMTLPVLAIGLAGALLWPTRLRRTLVVLGTALFTLWLAVAWSPLSRALARPLVRADAVQPADAIFVLSSNVQPDGDPSASALARVTRALELFGQHLAPRLVLSELPPPAGSYQQYVTGSAAQMGLAVEGALENVGVVGTTHDEAERVAALFRARGWRRLLLVTSPTHTRRAAAVFERAGVPEVIAVPCRETLFDLQGMRSSDERITAFGVVAHEWVGLWAYHLRGWI